MKTVLAGIRDTVRTQLWPLPVAAVLLAAIGGVFLPRLDSRVDQHVPGWLADVIFGGDAGAASTLLDAISSSLITVTSLTFSLTVVTLQLASGQFSPRLLRTFTSDMFVQATLALFLATFTFSLTTLRAVRSDDDAGGGFVPRISVTFAFVLAVLSVVALVLFLAHLARQIRVETMLREVHRDASETIDVVTSESQPEGAFPDPPGNASQVLVRRSGFLTSVDEAALRRAAARFGCWIRIDREPGSSLIAGTPLGSMWRADGELGNEAEKEVLDEICDAVRVGFEQTAAQDVGYGLRQLTDVANKALSPGINDPTTAIHALAHISGLLCRLAQCRLGPVVLSDEDGVDRVRLNRPTFASLLNEAITQPRRYGSSDPFVMRRLFLLLVEVAWVADTAPALDAVRDQTVRLEQTIRASDFDAAEREMLAEAARRVEAGLNR